jgi:uncharacterized protein
MRNAFIACFLLAVVPCLIRSISQPEYEMQESLIAARDGVRLNTKIYTPKFPGGPFPIVLIRTPYGTDNSRTMVTGYLKELADDGYIFVMQDIRGRFKSEGQFVMLRTPRDRNDPKSIDEGTDTYDTIEWLLNNVPNNNGRVGMLGISYGGWLTAMAILEPHPALKVASPQAPPADMYLGDDFHHNGAFRLSYGLEYVASLERSKGITRFEFDRWDTFDWYLRLGALSNVDEKYFHGALPTWNDFVAHPNHDAFWQKQSVARYLEHVRVPTLNVAGWWDQEDFYGPLKIYETLEKHDSYRMNYLVAGPWNHGGWRGDGSRLGAVDFEVPTGKYFREKVQAPFFAYFLKDKGRLDQPKALVFQTGANKWESYDEWPPHGSVTERKLYFHGGGHLSFEAPKQRAAQPFDSYVSDPAHPVPYRHRPIEPTYSSGSGWSTWLVEDQRFVHLRPDVLSLETDPLQEDIAVAGGIAAHLFASTSGSDSDWIVKLIDVYPESYPKDPHMAGYQLMIANEVFRSRFGKSFERPEPLVPNQVKEYTIDLHSNDHRFLKGHRIMVQVQSTWFPLIDRNPQKFVSNIFKAKDSDYQVATQRVFSSVRFPSHINLPVLRGDEVGSVRRMANVGH